MAASTNSTAVEALMGLAARSGTDTNDSSHAGALAAQARALADAAEEEEERLSERLTQLRADKQAARARAAEIESQANTTAEPVDAIEALRADLAAAGLSQLVNKIIDGLGVESSAELRAYPYDDFVAALATLAEPVILKPAQIKKVKAFIGVHAPVSRRPVPVSDPSPASMAAIAQEISSHAQSKKKPMLDDCEHHEQSDPLAPRPASLSAQPTSSGCSAAQDALARPHWNMENNLAAQPTSCTSTTSKNANNMPSGAHAHEPSQVMPQQQGSSFAGSSYTAPPPSLVLPPVQPPPMSTTMPTHNLPPATSQPSSSSAAKPKKSTASPGRGGKAKFSWVMLQCPPGKHEQPVSKPIGQSLSPAEKPLKKLRGHAGFAWQPIHY